MSSPATQLTGSGMGINEPFRQISQWVDSIKNDINTNTAATNTVQEDIRSDKVRMVNLAVLAFMYRSYYILTSML